MAPHATGGSDTCSNTPETSSEANGDAKQDGYRSLPVPNPCLSHWHRTTRAFEHLNTNEHVPVPATAKYVIIGSGLSGSLTAWSLVVDHGVAAKNLVLLEAREAVSGASGRNAGHVRPDAFRGFAAYARIHGPEQARKILENEKLVFEKVDAFIREHNVPCDFNSTTTFDVCLTPEFVAHQKESFSAYQNAGGDVTHVQYFEGEEAKSRTGIKDVLAAYEWPAGSSHPAKLAQWLLGQLIERGVSLWTHCAAMKISEHEARDVDDHAKWDITTPRGTIATEVVIHCTNAYAAHLLPELSSFVTPNRAQAHSIIPGSELSGARAQKSTMSLRYSLKHFFSFIQRTIDGTVVFGVSRLHPGWSQETIRSIVNFDDSGYNTEIADSSSEAYRELFQGTKFRATRHGEGDEYHWTGIIAMTPDSVPIVGAVEGKEGQYILAGHNGHGKSFETEGLGRVLNADECALVGMARIWACAPGLAKLVLGESWAATGLPECFRYSKARLDRAAQQNITSVW